MKNEKFVVTSLFLIIFCSILITNGNLSGSPILKNKLDLKISGNSSKGDSTVIKAIPLNIQQTTNNYTYNLTWSNSQVIVNQSILINSSTEIVIDNCSVFFVPSNPLTHIVVSTEEFCKLNITNSVITVISGYASLIFHGIETYIHNSTIIGLGENDYLPGLYLNSETISITDSKFISGYHGFIFSDSIYTNINNCSFQDIVGIDGYGGTGIVGINSNGIDISNCSFSNSISAGYFHNCYSISISNIQCNGGNSGIDIYPNQFHFEVINVLIEECMFQNLSIGIRVIGQNINILNNTFVNLRVAGLFIGGRDIAINDNLFHNTSRGIITPTSLVSNDPNQVTFSSISNVIICNNTFNETSEQCIVLSNYEYHTIFYILQNNFTNIGTGISFEGNLGGSGIDDRSYVAGNIFNNITEYAIEGESLNYLARIQHISFFQNAFLNSSNGYISFQSRYYYMDDVQWDDGFLGNYWSSLVNELVQDEDDNLIGDKLYIVSVDHGQFDQAPLLSLKFVKTVANIVSDHPSDFARSKSELRGINASLQWNLRINTDSNVIIFSDGQIYQSSLNSSTIEVSLLGLDIGLHNLTLVIQSDNLTYNDLVWVRILKDEINIFRDVFVPIGALIFIIAIITVGGFSINKRYFKIKVK